MNLMILYVSTAAVLRFRCRIATLDGRMAGWLYSCIVVWSYGCIASYYYCMYTSSTVHV